MTLHRTSARIAQWGRQKKPRMFGKSLVAEDEYYPRRWCSSACLPSHSLCMELVSSQLLRLLKDYGMRGTIHSHTEHGGSYMYTRLRRSRPYKMNRMYK